MLNQLTETLTTLITNLYVSTGLVGILLAMAIESCCIPLPSEIVMPLAGVMFASGRLLPGVSPWVALLLIALTGAVGCLIGSIAAYGIGYSGGRPLMLKYGRYVLISQHDADKADRFFQRWGSATAFFSRLLPVVRTYISLPAGIAKMPFGKFCVYTVLGSFPWCLMLAYVGTIVGNHLGTLSPIFHSLDVVIAVVLVVLVALYIWRHIRNDRKARAALAALQANPMRPVPPQGFPPQQPWGQSSQQAWGQPLPHVQQPWSQGQGQPQTWTPSRAPQSPPPFQQPWPQNQPQQWGPAQDGDNDRTIQRR
ncbi:MAG: DedA family protein [Ktedonobacteraceae bacterium]|nr:DedA family protein [Chloroflexota bacterium]